MERPNPDPAHSTPSLAERECDHFHQLGECVFCGQPTPARTLANSRSTRSPRRSGGRTVHTGKRDNRGRRSR